MHTMVRIIIVILEYFRRNLSLKNEIKYNLKTVDEKKFIGRTEKKQMTQYFKVIIKGKSCFAF